MYFNNKKNYAGRNFDIITTKIKEKEIRKSLKQSTTNHFRHYRP